MAKRLVGVTLSLSTRRDENVKNVPSAQIVTSPVATKDWVVAMKTGAMVAKTNSPQSLLLIPYYITVLFNLCLIFIYVLNSCYIKSP